MSPFDDSLNQDVVFLLVVGDSAVIEIAIFAEQLLICHKSLGEQGVGYLKMLDGLEVAVASDDLREDQKGLPDRGEVGVYFVLLVQDVEAVQLLESRAHFQDLFVFDFSVKLEFLLVEFNVLVGASGD